MKRNVSSSIRTPSIEKSSWTTDEWLAEFGDTYDIRTRSHLTLCCSNRTLIVNGKEYAYQLPQGWQARKLPGGRGIWLIELDGRPLEIIPKLSHQRMAQAKELLKQGYNQKEIADKLGLTESGVSRIFKRLKQQKAESSAKPAIKKLARKQKKDNRA